MKAYEPEIDSLALIPSDGGKFEVEVNGKLVYSKLATGRHAQSGEISGLIREIAEKG